MAYFYGLCYLFCFKVSFLSISRSFNFPDHFPILVVFNRFPKRLKILICKNDELQPFPDHHLDYPRWCGLPTLWILSIGTRFFALEKKDGWPRVMSQGWIMLWALLTVAAVYVLCLLKDWADKRSKAQKNKCSFSRCYYFITSGLGIR